jgi:hypothetical protein
VFKKVFILIIFLLCFYYCEQIYFNEEKGGSDIMAIELIDAPTGGAPVSTDDYNNQNILLQSLIYHLMNKTLHLTEWDTLTIPELAENSFIQHGGATFQVKDSDASISGSPSDGRVYIKVERSGDVLTASFVNSASGYSWNSVYNGFYHSDESQLLPYVLYKDSSDYHKYNLDGLDNKFDITSDLYVEKIIDIGSWDMNTTTSTTTSHNLPGNLYLNIVEAHAMIYPNGTVTIIYPLKQLDNVASGRISGSIYQINSTVFSLRRYTTGGFDNSSFGGTSYNRGIIKFRYFL